MSWELKLINKRNENIKNILIFLFFVAIPVSFWLGFKIVKPNLEQTKIIKSLEDEIQKNESQIEILRKTIIFLKTKDGINESSEEDTRQTIKMLENQLFQSHQKLNQYVHILDKNSDNYQLSIDSINLLPSLDENIYKLKMFLSSTRRDTQTLDLKIDVIFQGNEDNKEKMLYLKDLADIGGDSIEASLNNLLIIPESNNFIYIKLPEKFNIENIIVRVIIAKSKQVVEKIFPWNE